MAAVTYRFKWVGAVKSLLKQNINPAITVDFINVLPTAFTDVVVDPDVPGSDTQMDLEDVMLTIGWVLFAVNPAGPPNPPAPVNVTKSAAVIGASNEASRADHKHDIDTAVVGNVGTANAEGAATSLARSDHTHNLPFTPVQTALNAASGAVGFNNQNCTGVNSIAVLGGTASTAGGIRTPFNAAAQTIIGGKKSAGTQNDILSTIGAQIYIGINASAGTAWDYIYLVTNQYMVLYPQIQGQFHSSTGEKACWQNEGWSFGPSNAPTWGGGVNVISVQNAGTNPTSNPTNSFLIYSDAGAGKARGSGGTVTTFAPADPHCKECGSDHCIEYETEIFDEYTKVCIRCLVSHVKELQEVVSKLDPSTILKNIETIAVTDRSKKG